MHQTVPEALLLRPDCLRGLHSLRSRSGLERLGQRMRCCGVTAAMLLSTACTHLAPADMTPSGISATATAPTGSAPDRPGMNKAASMTSNCSPSIDTAPAAQLATGEECLLRLASNPSTGYRWRLEPVEPAIVEQVGEAEFVAAPAGAGAPVVGAGGVEIFRLRGSSPGQASLRFAYRRPWEPADQPPAATHVLLMTVR
jgi:inhibitor of cysteine peptidase